MDSYSMQYEDEMWDAIVSMDGPRDVLGPAGWDQVNYDGPNPVIKVTRLRAYRGFVVREYLDGMFDATDGRCLSPGFDSFREAVAWVRSQA